MAALLGCRVSLVEGGSTFSGEVKQHDPVLGKLAICLEGGELQNFFSKDLTSVTILEEDHKGLKAVDQAQPSESDGRPETIGGKSDLREVFESVRPEQAVRLGTPGGRNDHLCHMIRVNMAQLLHLQPPLPTPSLPHYEDHKGFTYLQLPAVCSTSRPRVDVFGHILARSPVTAGIREQTWPDQDTPPQILTPSRLYLVEEVGELFEEAVARLLSSQTLGLSGEGDMVGRRAPLAWLLLATGLDVFMFDMEALGEEGWSYGLRTVLQDPGLTKVTHDCRALSDCLWHRHKVLLAGVWDTAAGDVVFVSNTVSQGLLPRYSRSLASLLKDYLGVEDSHLAFPRYRQARLAADLDIWRQRPLPLHLSLMAARGVLYLCSLYHKVRAATLQPFNRAVAVLNQHVRDQDEPDAASMVFEADQVPGRVRGLLPTWDRERGVRRLVEKGFLVEGSFLHNNVGNPDPVLIYSRDSMHQAST